ncbi:hypothetical protein PMAYCL1PPCAC_05839, partial [Pristionchus mayeri]
DFTATFRYDSTFQMVMAAAAATYAYCIGAMLVSYANFPPNLIHLLYVITNNALLATFVLSSFSILASIYAMIVLFFESEQAHEACGSDGFLNVDARLRLFMQLSSETPFGLHRMHLFAVVVGRSMTIGGVPLAHLVTCGVLIELVLAVTKEKRG